MLSLYGYEHLFFLFNSIIHIFTTQLCQRERSINFAETGSMHFLLVDWRVWDVWPTNSSVSLWSKWVISVSQLQTLGPPPLNPPPIIKEKEETTVSHPPVRVSEPDNQIGLHNFGTHRRLAPHCSDNAVSVREPCLPPLLRLPHDT
jgi:hypothetical protein